MAKDGDDILNLLEKLNDGILKVKRPSEKKNRKFVELEGPSLKKSTSLEKSFFKQL